MALEERHSERFDDIGRVEIPELCGISATLENISKDGCKIHYSAICIKRSLPSAHDRMYYYKPDSQMHILK